MEQIGKQNVANAENASNFWSEGLWGKGGTKDNPTTEGRWEVGKKYIGLDGKEFTATQDFINQASQKAVEATNNLFNAQTKLAKTIKDKLTWELKAREDVNGGLTDTIALEDDIRHELELLGEDDFVGKADITERLLGNTTQRKQTLQHLKDLAIVERDTYAMGSMEWTVLNNKAKDYDEQIEDTTSAIFEQAKALGELKAKSLTVSFDDQIESINKVISAFGNIDTDAESAAVNELMNNIGNILLKESESIAKKINDIKAEIKITTDTTKLIALNSELEQLTDKQYEVRISVVGNAESRIETYNNNLKKSIGLQKKVADLQKQIRDAELQQALKIAGASLDKINNEIGKTDYLINLNENGTFNPGANVDVPIIKYRTPKAVGEKIAVENPIEDSTETPIDFMMSETTKSSTSYITTLNDTINPIFNKISALGTITKDNMGEFTTLYQSILQDTSALTDSLPTIQEGIRALGKSMNLPPDIIENFVTIFTIPIQTAITEAESTVKTQITTAGQDLAKGLLPVIETTSGTFVTAISNAKDIFNTDKDILLASVNTGAEESKTAYISAAKDAVQSAYDYLGTLNTGLSAINGRILELEKLKKSGALTPLQEAELTALKTMKVNVETDITATKTSITDLGTQIQTQLSEEDIESIEINIDGNATPLNKTLDAILKPKKKDDSNTLTLNVTGDTAEAVAQVQTFFNNWDGKPVTLNVSALTLDAQTAVENFVNSMNNKSIVIKTTIATNDVPAHAKGTKSSPGGISIISEKGRELIISNGKIYLSGNNGAELVNLPEGAQVIANQQTEQILKELGIPAYAEGTNNTTNSTTKSIGQISFSANMVSLLTDKIDLLEKVAPIVEAEVTKLLDSIASFKNADGTYNEDADGVVADTINQIKNLVSAGQQAQLALKAAIKERYDSDFEQMEKKEKGLNDTIESENKLQHQINMLDEKDYSGKLTLTEKLIGTTQKQKEALTNLRDTAKAERDVYKVNSTQWTILNDKVKNYDEQLKNVDETLRDLGNTTKELKQSQLNTIKTTEEQIIGMIKKRVEAERQSLSDTLTDTKKNIDARINYINKLYDNEDYQNQLKEEQKTLRDLYEEQAKWILDNSLEGKNKQTDISKQIVKQEDKINSLQRQKGKSLRIEQLNDEKTKAQEETEGKQKELEKQLKNENLYAEARKALIDGTLLYFTDDGDGKIVKQNMGLENAFISFTNTYGEGLSILGDTIKADFARSITVAKDTLIDLNKIISSLFQSDINKWNNPNNFDKINNWVSANPDKWDRILDECESGTVSVAETIKKLVRLIGLESGGYTGDFAGGRLALLHKKELVLNKLDTENILKTVNITRNIVENIKPLNYQNLTNGTISKQDIKFNFDNLINVQGNVDKDALPGLKDIAKYTINELKREFNKQGIFRGV
ncbi:MAG: hypothetical protein M0Q94_12045 [Candidatus Cloacimonetes bacterium]|nr:hypothetical protein [Candidatus Cloacimonadota bacterium]